MNKSSEDHQRYLTGEYLYGDDFSEDQILSWFKDEEEGYANLGAGNQASYNYLYHQLNIYHGFRHLKKRSFKLALGLGSAYCDELSPITSQISRITVLEPSSAFDGVTKVHGVPCSFVKPLPSGNMEFETNTFDLITCLGVLHHIPNVSHVMSESFRVLAPGGIMILREPLSSMGDWRYPRANLTPHERGIPVNLMKKMINEVGFKVKKYSPCMFQPIPKICNRIGVTPYNSRITTLVDAMLSKFFSWNIRYRRTSTFHKFAPASMFFVLEKT